MAKRRQLSKVEFDIETIRQWKRLAKRLVRNMQEVERSLMKMRPKEDQEVNIPKQMRKTLVDLMSEEPWPEKP